MERSCSPLASMSSYQPPSIQQIHLPLICSSGCLTKPFLAPNLQTWWLSGGPSIALLRPRLWCTSLACHSCSRSPQSRSAILSSRRTRSRRRINFPSIDIHSDFCWDPQTSNALWQIMHSHRISATGSCSFAALPLMFCLFSCRLWRSGCLRTFRMQNSKCSHFGATIPFSASNLC